MNWSTVATCVSFGLLPCLLVFMILVIGLIWHHSRTVHALEKKVQEAFDKGRVQGIADTILANNLLIRSN